LLTPTAISLVPRQTPAAATHSATPFPLGLLKFSVCFAVDFRYVSAEFPLLPTFWYL